VPQGPDPPDGLQQWVQVLPLAAPVSNFRQPVPAPQSRQQPPQHRPQQAQHLMLGSLVGMVQAGRADLAVADWTIA
jgi:hypothetical protein